jgi:hypothetical protein
LAPSFELFGGLGRTDSPVSGRLGFFYDGNRSAELAPGTVSWQRYGLSLGPSYRVRQGGLTLEVAALGMASLLSASGAGFTTNEAGQAVVGGLGIQLEGSRSFGPVTVGVQVRPVLWLAQEQLSVPGTAAPISPSTTELWVSVLVDYTGG